MTESTQEIFLFISIIIAALAVYAYLFVPSRSQITAAVEDEFLASYPTVSVHRFTFREHLQFGRPMAHFVHVDWPLRQYKRFDQHSYFRKVLATDADGTEHTIYLEAKFHGKKLVHCDVVKRYTY